MLYVGWALLVATFAPPLPAPKPKTAFNRLVFAGDVMFCRAVRREMIAAHDAALPMRKAAPLLASADLAFVNLESPFSDKGPYHQGGLIFHAAPEAIAGLELAHVAVVSTANNHARDCGAHGVSFTVEWLRAHHMEAVGTADSAQATHQGVVVERNGIRFGFLGYTYDQQNGNWRDIDDRIALADPAAVCRDVRALKRRADVVIVSMHSGIEYAPRPNAAQVAFAHAAIGAGATLVVGHHPHVVQPVEKYKGGVIFYSLGNFVFDQFQREATQRGAVAEADFIGRFLAAESLWPVKITLTGPEFEK